MSEVAMCSEMTFDGWPPPPTRPGRLGMSERVEGAGAAGVELPETDYATALANFVYKGGAVRLAEPVTDPIIRGMEWGHAEKDEFTVPFGPWSEPDSVSAGPWVYRYGTASAATGSRYAVLLTKVHADIASREGGPIVVTVLSPWNTSYVVAEQGYLDSSYVAEKLTAGRAREGVLHSGDLAALTRLIGLLLGRETSADLVSRPGQPAQPTAAPSAAGGADGGAGRG